MSFSNTFDTTNTGSAVSNREDLTDVLTILAPEETPVLSSASKQKASATFAEWTVDELASPKTTGISEGADVTTFTDKFSGRARLGNYVQKFRRDYMVSDLQDAVDSVGPAKIAQAEAKAIRELKRDVEATLIGTGDAQIENGAGIPYKMRGLGKWIQTGAQSDSAPETPVAYRPDAGQVFDISASTAGAFQESDLNNIISTIYRHTGSTQNLTLVADTGLRKTISNFARFVGTGANFDGNANASLRNVNYNGDTTTIKLSVEIYESDFGRVSIVNMNPDTAPATLAGGSDFNDGYIVNPEYYGVHELIPMGSTRLPNLGGGERGYVDCSLTLGVYHPQAHGKITQ
jgi:hypothetical protein